MVFWIAAIIRRFQRISHKAIDNDFIGNVIDVCPVGALTDKTFRFKNRVWFLKPWMHIGIVRNAVAK